MMTLCGVGGFVALEHSTQSINQSINQTCMPVGNPFGRRWSAETYLIRTRLNKHQGRSYLRLTVQRIFNVCKIEGIPPWGVAKVPYLVPVFAIRPFAKIARRRISCKPPFSHQELEGAKKLGDNTRDTNWQHSASSVEHGKTWRWKRDARDVPIPKYSVTRIHVSANVVPPSAAIFQNYLAITSNHSAPWGPATTSCRRTQHHVVIEIHEGARSHTGQTKQGV